MGLNKDLLQEAKKKTLFVFFLCVFVFVLFYSFLWSFVENLSIQQNSSGDGEPR